MRLVRVFRRGIFCNFDGSAKNTVFCRLSKFFLDSRSAFFFVLSSIYSRSFNSTLAAIRIARLRQHGATDSPSAGRFALNFTSRVTRSAQTTSCAFFGYLRGQSIYISSYLPPYLARTFLPSFLPRAYVTLSPSKLFYVARRCSYL